MKLLKFIQIAFCTIFVQNAILAQDIFPLKVPQKVQSDGEQFYDFELYNSVTKSRKKIVLNSTQGSSSYIGKNNITIVDFNVIKTFSLEGKLLAQKIMKEPSIIVGGTLSTDKANIILLMANNISNKFSVKEYSQSNYLLKSVAENLNLNNGLGITHIGLLSNGHLMIENSDLSLSELDMVSKKVMKKIKLEQGSDEQCASPFVSFQKNNSYYFSYSANCKDYNLISKELINSGNKILTKGRLESNSTFPIMINNNGATLLFTGKETYHINDSKLEKIKNINSKKILFFDNTLIISKNPKGELDTVKF